MALKTLKKKAYSPKDNKSTKIKNIPIHYAYRY